MSVQNLNITVLSGEEGTKTSKLAWFHPTEKLKSYLGTYGLHAVSVNKVAYQHAVRARKDVKLNLHFWLEFGQADENEKWVIHYQKRFNPWGKVEYRFSIRPYIFEEFEKANGNILPADTCEKITEETLRDWMQECEAGCETQNVIDAFSA